MLDADFEAALDVANELARAWLAGTDQRLVTASADAATVLASLPAALPSTGMEPAAVLRELAACAEPGLAGTGSGRYLALVTGGVLPSALGADWLVSAWDQNASFGELYPAAVAIEHAAGRWILDLLNLPDESAVGFTTGAQGANTATLLAARNAVLAAHGYDVEAHGLQGAPRVNVVVGDEQHSTVFRSLRFAGLGADTAIRIPTDEQGRMIPSALTAALETLDGPTIVYAQAGNVNGGGFDPIAKDCGHAGTPSESNAQPGVYGALSGNDCRWQFRCNTDICIDGRSRLGQAESANSLRASLQCCAAMSRGAGRRNKWHAARHRRRSIAG